MFDEVEIYGVTYIKQQSKYYKKSPRFIGTNEPFSDDDEDGCHVVTVWWDDFAVFDYAADDLVGTFFCFKLVISFGNEVSLNRMMFTT